MENKEKTESILIRLDEVKQKNLNSHKTYPSHSFSLTPLKCIYGQFKTKILCVLKISFKYSWELYPLKYQSTWLWIWILRCLLGLDSLENMNICHSIESWRQQSWSDSVFRQHTGIVPWSPHCKEKRGPQLQVCRSPKC